MTWDKDKPADGRDGYLVDDDIRANFAALDTVIGAAKIAAGVALFDTTSGHDHDGTDSKLISAQFGAWVDKSSGYGAQAATTDGFVIAYDTDGAAELIGYTDGNSNPTTIRARSGAFASATQSFIFFPVRKGDYWKVTGSPNAVYWLSMGS